MTDASERAETAAAAAEAGAAVASALFDEDLSVETKMNKTDVVTRADREAEVAVLDEIREAFPDDAVVAEESASDAAVPETGPAWIVDPIDGTNNYVRGIPLWATAVAAVVDGEPVAASVVLPELGDTFVAGGSGTTGDGAETTGDGTSTTRDGDPVSVSDRSDPETMSVAPTIWWPRDRRDEYAAAAGAIVHRFGDLVRFRSAQLTLALVAAGSLDATFSNLTPNPWDSVAGAFLVRQAGGTVTDLDGERWRHDGHGFVVSNGACHEAVLAAARETEDAATK